jgi:hypothetical protein
MSRLTMLFVAVALVLPGAALAQPIANLRAPDRDERSRAGLGRHSASFGTEQSLPAPAPAPAPAATDGDGVSMTLAVAGGVALMLLAGGLGVYAGGKLRPRLGGA